MAFENVDLFDAVANASLEKYGWQDRCEAKLIVLSENATYMVKNKETGEKEGVLRISRPGYHTLDELNSEMKWLRQINDYTPLLVANPIKGLDGKNIGPGDFMNIIGPIITVSKSVNTEPTSPPAISVALLINACLKVR